MADIPKNMVVALRELSDAIKGKTITPEWFRERQAKDGHLVAWTTLLSSASDELETMQKLNGKLYKTLYPD